MVANWTVIGYETACGDPLFVIRMNLLYLC